jgi:hypothetical protein
MKKRLAAVLAAVFAATVLGSGAVSSTQAGNAGQDWERRPSTHSVAIGHDWEFAPTTSSNRGLDWE